jgi:hypothetical protein
MILHVALLGWLIWYGHVRDIVLERGKPKREALIRGKELEKVIEQMQRSVAEELEDRVQLLKQGQDRMATNFDTLNAHFQPFEQSQKATAMLRFETYAKALLADQKTVMQVLEKVKADRNFDAASQIGQEKMPVMISALDEVRRGVLLMTTDQSLADQQTQVETATFEVERSLREMGNLLGRHRRLEREIEQSKQEMAKLKPIMDQSQVEQSQIKAAYDSIEQQRKAAQDQLNALRNAKPKNNEAIKHATETFRKLHDQYNNDRKTLSVVSRKAKDDLNRFYRENQRFEDRQRAFDGLKTNERLSEYLQTAMEQLTRAMTLESHVIEQVLSAEKQAAGEVPAS